MKLIIVGGVAGGASAAARARRQAESAEIILFERGPHVSFANCGLPYYVSGHIADRNKLFVTTADRLRQRFRLDVREQTAVEAIDPQAKTVLARHLLTGQTYTESFDKLILAPGAAPLRPDWPGVDHPGVFTLRSVPDVDRIKAATVHTRQAVLIGGGFINIELAENLDRLGIHVTLLDRNPQLLSPFDPEMTTPLMEALAARGISVRLSVNVKRIDTSAEGLEVVLANGERLLGQMVVIGIGVRPESTLAQQAGLELGPRGGIRVNDHMQTSHPDIYAVGDVAETSDFLTEERVQVPLAGPANRQGRLAADHALGFPAHYRGTQATAILGFYDLTLAITGASEKVLHQRGQAYRQVMIHPAHHAGYYPGAQPMTLKLLFDPTNGRILGAQGVGTAGVDKRIDVLAVALQAGMTVYQLEEAELCYAPQYGSAKDPINMLGFVASGMLRGEHPQITWVEWKMAEPQTMLIDVRTPEEFANGAVPGAVNIPVDELRQRLGELPRQQPLAVYCQVGQRGYLATRILLQHGYRAVNLSGGYKSYRLLSSTAQFV